MSASSCRLCWLWENRPDYRVRWSVAGTRPAAAPQAPCDHLGGPTGQTVPCGTCPRGVRLKLHACSVHGECVLGKGSDGVTGCDGCPDRSSWPVRHDETTLWPGVPGKRFNPSLLAHDGGYLLAVRNGWAGSQIYLGRLDRDFRPVGEPWLLDLYHRTGANYGREDPRLFWHDGAVHVSFTGVVGGREIRHTDVLYARLGRDLRVERLYRPRPSPRKVFEKNWLFFSQEGRLYAVYTIDPYRVVEVRGEEVIPLHDCPNPLPWRGGERRGGSAPTPHGGRLWAAFHDRVPHAGTWRYRTGVMTLSPEPPFVPLAHTPVPILEADLHDKPADQWSYVVYTGGMVIDPAQDRVILASGRQDRWLTLDRFPLSDLDSRLYS